MTDTMQSLSTELTESDAASIAAAWIAALAAALRDGSADELGALFAPDATWRDFMAFDWDFSHTVGREQTVAKLRAKAQLFAAAGFTVSRDQAPTLTDGVIHTFFDFTTRDRVTSGYVTLVNGEGRYRGQVFQTQVAALSEYPEAARHHRREGKVYGIVENRTRWADDRAAERSFETGEPTVVIMGAGHNGLAIAARLNALDVSTLVVEKEDRVGDQWRKRYASLALHSSVYGDHLPYLPNPPVWPAHTPKDKFADWLESYANLLDLNVWTGTPFIDAEYDEESETWTVRVRRPDGSIRALHPRHFVVAGGLYGVPKIPQIKGIETFTGIASHSDEFQRGADFSGRRAVVIGAGVSGHELAHDLWEHGADVTMIQRSSTYVVSYSSYHRFFSTLFTEDMPYSADIADQMTYARPPETSDEVSKHLTGLAKEADKELLDGLEARGFKLNFGPDGGGILAAITNGMDSFQIDIGASQLIADGSIHLKQGVEVAQIDGKTLTFTDGSILEDVEVIIFATGYHQFWGHIKPALGAVGEKFDKVYGRAADGEYANTWRRSSQPGLWFGTGFIRMCRYYSRFMALLIKAIEEGIEPLDPAKAAANPEVDL